MRVAHNKLPEQTLINRCNELNLEYIRSSSEGGRTYVHFLCRKHEDRGEQRSAWYHFKNAAHGCAYCSGKHKTKDELQAELDEKEVPVTIISEYVSAKSKIIYRCNICNKEFSATPNSLLNRQACPECAVIRRGNKRRKSTDAFAEDLFRVQPNIEIIGKYTGSHSLVKCRCKNDGYEWESYPANLLNRSAGCPVCNHKISRGETVIMNYLRIAGVEYEYNYSFDDCKRIHKLRFDFYLPELNTAIEFDGIQHFEEVPRFNDGCNSLQLTQERDKIKDEYCSEHGIKLIRIPFYDITNIEEILDSELIIDKNTA